MIRRFALSVVALAACGNPNDPANDAAIDASTPNGGAVLYPPTQTLSPLTPDMVAHLVAVHGTGTGHDDVFAKVGASNTVNTNHLTCFAGTNVRLDGRDLGAAIDHFKAGDAAGTTPFERVSLAATVGWAAFQALAGSPSPLDQELAAIDPAFATIMFGTNDIGYNRIDRYGQNLAAIADELLGRGIIPIFTTIPSRDDDPAANAQVPEYNAISRGIAQTRGVPFIDVQRELIQLPSHGIGSDGIHLEAYSGGACVFDATGLMHGHNLRNLRVIETLDRLRRTVLAGETAPDADAPRLQGAGSPDDPFRIEVLPFADRRDTSTFGASMIASYPPCAPADESGNEVYYRIEVTAPITLHAYMIDSDADIDLQLLRDAPTAESCIARDNLELGVAVTPGTYYVVADTFAGKAGDYTLVVTSTAP